jgi:hypothetical protein
MYACSRDRDLNKSSITLLAGQVLFLILLLLILCRLLNSISLGGSDNLLVGVKCEGKHRNVILSTQSKSTFKKHLQLAHLITNLSHYTFNSISKGVEVKFTCYRSRLRPSSVCLSPIFF